MAEDSFDKVISWIDTLTAPGVLVLPCPLFAEPSNASLPCYPDQYVPMTRALVKCKHTVVVLVGDSNYGEIARCDAHGIVQITASSLCCPPKDAGPRDLQHAPALFPPVIVAKQIGDGVQAAAIDRVYTTPQVVAQGGRSEDHFVDLEFKDTSRGIELSVTFVLLPRDGGPQPSTFVLELG